MDSAEASERRVEQARESLHDRVEELGRRMQDAKDKLDIKAHIAAHPRLAVGIAFAAGVLLAIPGKRVKDALPASGADVKSGLLGAMVATIGSIAFQLAKSVAFHQLSGSAKDWWDKNQAMHAGASNPSDAESFLK